MAPPHFSDLKRLAISGRLHAGGWGGASAPAVARPPPDDAVPPQRDLLLCEAHHRIKNSLQLVVSLLQLQARTCSGSPTANEALMQASRRIRAIAQMHEGLQVSMSGDVALPAYLRQLCSDLSHALAEADTGPVSVEAEEVMLPAARAMVVGLIVNELVTNALKHGRRSDGTGQVQVVAAAGHDGTLRLVVADDGPGLPGNPAPGACNGLGMQLVRDLLRPLAGQLKVDGAPPGTRVTLLLPARAGGRAGCPSGPEGA